MLSEQLQKKVDRALRLLRQICPPQSEPIEVAYSGGKDSDTILQLVREAGIPYRAIYKNTTIDPPGTIPHVRAMGVEVRQPKESFLQLVRRKGLPSRLARFCCEHLKEYKILDKCIIGVRRDESKAREERYLEPTQCLYYGKKKTPEAHVEAIYPILDWTSQDVADFLADRGIKCAPVYYDADGKFHVERRLGCMGCPLISKQKRIAELKQHPKLVKAILRAANDYRRTHPNAVSVNKYDDVYEYFVRNYYYTAERDFEDATLGLFGKPDFKAFLEREFGIDLTIK